MVEINLSIKQALQREGVLLAYLFGSEASGYTHRESDVDIAVLLDDKISPEYYFDKSLALPEYFAGLYPKRIISVVILNEAPPLLKHEVLRNGILLVNLDDDARVRFHVQTVRDYEDTKYLRQVQSYYLHRRLK